MTEQVKQNEAKANQTRLTGTKPKQTETDGIKRRLVTVILTDDDLFRLGVITLKEEYEYMQDANLSPVGEPSKTKAGYLMEYEMV